MARQADKSYVATFHGDICDIPPVVGSTLEECLTRLMDATNFGKAIKDVKEPSIRNSTFPNHLGSDRTHPQFYNDWNDPDEIIAPDPEDDKIEIWEYDPEKKTAKIVWGFWGWHWMMPDNMDQGILPGHEMSLYEIAMREH